MEEALTKKYKGKDLFIFWIRLLGWIIASAGLPIGVFAWKFGLFEEKAYTPVYDEAGNLVTTSLALNGWGIVSCLIIGWTLIQLVKEAYKSCQGYSFYKQVLYGLSHRILPLAIMFLICYWLDGILYNILYCLGTLLVSQVLAIPLNPMPKYRKDVKGIEDYSDLYYNLSKLIAKNMKEKKEE